MPQIMLFSRCMGVNDGTGVEDKKVNYKTGETELDDCLNMTVTPEGALQKAPTFSTIYAHSNPVEFVSADSRLFFGDGYDVYEYVGGANPVANRFNLLDGKMVHTPVDVRLSATSKVYKSVNPTGTATEAIVGTNPNPSTSIVLSKMPLFDGAFLYNGRLYLWKGKFIQYSEPYGYDLWDLANAFIPHGYTVLQAGAIPGVMVAAHAEGVTVYLGSSPADFVRVFYPCRYMANTLYSGYIGKSIGYGHLFMSDDGVWMIDREGQLLRVSGDALNNVSSLNTSYRCATVDDGKYLAFGNSVCVEYDFRAKAVMKRQASGVLSAAGFMGYQVFAKENTVSRFSSLAQDYISDCSVTFPYSNLGVDARKSLIDLYFTGELTRGDLTIELWDKDNPDDARWTIDVPDFEGKVHNKRIRLPKGIIGSRAQIKMSTTGFMTIEQLRLNVEAGRRS